MNIVCVLVRSCVRACVYIDTNGVEETQVKEPLAPEIYWINVFWWNSVFQIFLNVSV